MSNYMSIYGNHMLIGGLEHVFSIQLVPTD